MTNKKREVPPNDPIEEQLFFSPVGNVSWGRLMAASSMGSDLLAAQDWNTVQQYIRGEDVDLVSPTPSVVHEEMNESSDLTSTDLGTPVTIVTGPFENNGIDYDTLLRFSRGEDVEIDPSIFKSKPYTCEHNCSYCQKS